MCYTTKKSDRSNEHCIRRYTTPQDKLCIEIYYCMLTNWHDDVIKWKHFPRYWPSVRGIHRSPVNSPHKGQWRVALMFSLMCAWINGWINNVGAGDLRRCRAHYDVIVIRPEQDGHTNPRIPDFQMNGSHFAIRVCTSLVDPIMTTRRHDQVTVN